jgi:hypothetical protein
MINKIRVQLLRFVLWLERKMHADSDYSLNNPDWLELQNEANSLKRQLKGENKRLREALDEIGNGNGSYGWQKEVAKAALSKKKEGD